MDENRRDGVGPGHGYGYGPPMGPADDEISLYDIWETLRRRRWLVLLGLAVTLVVAGGYAATQTPMHRVSALIEVGQVPGNDGALAPLEAPGTVVTRLERILIPAAVEGAGGIGAAESAGAAEAAESVEAAGAAGAAGASAASLSAEVIDSNGGLIELSALVPATAIDPTRALMESVITALTDQHATRFAAREQWVQARIGEIQARADAEAADSVSGVEARQSLAAMQANQALAQPTRTVRAPAASASPEDSRLPLTFALGAVLGLMLGVFAAFIAEFLANARAYREAAEAQARGPAANGAEAAGSPTIEDAGREG